MADPEGGTGVLDPHLENHKLSNTDPDSPKITKLPSQHSMMGHHWPVNEMPFKWRFTGGPIMIHSQNQPSKDKT